MVSLQCHYPLPILLNSSSSPQINPQIPLFCSRLPSVPNRFHRTRNQTILRRSNSGNGGKPGRESPFFDENGAVEDMDGYLNYLSLEYDSVWDTKPSWCQPWTILLTGTGIITASWLVVNSVIITSLVATLICLWWYIFLYSYPKEYSNMIADRRRKVTSGLEDTYGTKTRQ